MSNVVILSGNVPNLKALRETLNVAAANTPGVLDIINNLKIA
jgi:osmotically-inducible protein OsmY